MKAKINKIKGCLMSMKTEWNTPKWIYEELNQEFQFDFDPCPENYSKDGLNIEWGNSNFVNPPYKENYLWLKKGYEQWQKGKKVIFLIPARTDTKYWHEFVMKATEIRFIQGRLKFGNAENSAPFPSVIVIFNIKEEKK